MKITSPIDFDTVVSDNQKNKNHIGGIKHSMTNPISKIGYSDTKGFLMEL
jgi:hypothetical protein